MADKSAIEWTDATWNPTRGCTKIAPGCAGHPYEHGFDPRLAPEQAHRGIVQRTSRRSSAQLSVPFSWKKPRRIFVDSMSDLFHEEFPFHYIAAVYAVMAITPWHTYQVLTKRPERAAEFYAWLGDDPAEKLSAAAFDHLAYEDIDCTVANFVNGWSRFHGHDDGNPADGSSKRWPLANVHVGTSVAKQPDADKNIPHLLRIPAAVRFLSVEPLIGPVEFSDVSGRSDAVEQLGKQALSGVDWVIVGGESGPGARPCDVAWIRSIVQQCKAADVAVFVKQLGRHPYVTDQSPEFGSDETNFGDFRFADRKGGDWNEWPADLRVRQFPVTDSSLVVTHG